jgi:glycosyltransferase involved in cell wall biosynthesis
MHLGVDLLFLVPGASGGRETYARELLRALRPLGGDLRVTAFVNRETAAAGRGFWTGDVDRTVVLPRASGSARAAWAAGELVALPRAAAAAGVDVLHSPANFAPFGGRFARVLTVHDLLHRERPELISAPVRLLTAAMLEPAARRAHRVITVSRASADAIGAALRLPPDRLVAIPNGLRLPSRPGDAGRARASLGAGERRAVALCVATDLPHKNLPGLLAGLAAIEPGERPLLALAGQGTDTGALPGRVAALGLADDVRLLGAVSTDALEDLYAAAAALVTATLAEGFGLPVLEAMARGVPVACSDLPVLREVAGDAAVYLDPRDPASIAAALGRALAGDEGRRVAGLERASHFSWRATAERTLAVYRDALAARR